MQKEDVPQAVVAGPPLSNTEAFRKEYKRLNEGERKEVQAAFCDRYKVTPSAFRLRLGGHTRVSDTERAWMEDKVATYFPARS